MPHLRARLAEGRPIFGTFVMLMSPNVVHALGTLKTAGLQWVAVDCQHQAVNEETLDDLIEAAHLEGLSCVVRVGVGDVTASELALDLGAEGIIFPSVHSETDARAVASSCRYPPHGRRSVGGLKTLLGRVDDQDPLCIVQIESKEGVDARASILAVDEVDGLFPGPVDLARSVGIAGEYRTFEEVVTALQPTLDEIEREAAGRGLIRMRHCENAAAVTSAVEAGCVLVTVGSDLSFVVQAGSQLFESVAG